MSVILPPTRQLHVGLQYPGGLAAGWNTLPRVTPLQWPNWGNSMGRNWGSLSLIALAPRSRRRSTVCPCYVLPSVECSGARPCLGNKLLSYTEIWFLVLQFVQLCTTELFVYFPCTTVQAIYILNWLSFLPNCNCIINCSFKYRQIK